MPHHSMYRASLFKVCGNSGGVRGMRNPSECSTDDARRMALVCLASLGSLVLSACSSEPNPDPKPSAAATLFNLDKVKEALQALSGAVDELESAVGGFDSEDWK